MYPYSWCSSMWHRRKGRWCQASGTRQATLWQPRAAGGPRVCPRVSPARSAEPAGVQVGAGSHVLAVGLAVESSAKALPFCALRGVEVHFHSVCFPVSVHRPPPPFRTGARISSPWAGGQSSKKSSGSGNWPRLCFCGKWPAFPAHQRQGVSSHPTPTQLRPPPSLLATVIPFSPDAALPPLITVTKKGCVPRMGVGGSSVPGPGLSPWGLGAWSFSGLPCQTAVSPLHCRAPGGGAGAGLSWSLLCPAAPGTVLNSVPFHGVGGLVGAEPGVGCPWSPAPEPMSDSRLTLAGPEQTPQASEFRGRGGQGHLTC